MYGLNTDNTRIIPIEQENTIKTIRKLENGDLDITLHSGKSFVIATENQLFQSFAVWTVLNDGF